MNPQLIYLFSIAIVIENVLCNYEWMYYLPYGQTVTLKPLKQNKSAEWGEIRQCKWTTPNNVDLYPNNLHSSRFFVDKYTCELTIQNIQKDTNGIYHCTINNLNISKAMLNYHGPPPKDFLDEYKWNLIAGFSTAGGIMAFFIFTCAVYRFRYRSEPENGAENTHQTVYHDTKSGYEMSDRHRRAEATNDCFDHDLERTHEHRASGITKVQRF